MITDDEIRVMGERAEERQPGGDPHRGLEDAVKRRVDELHGADGPKPLNRHERRREAALGRKRRG